MPERTLPIISKRALSQFIRSGCLRQLALNLYPDNSYYEKVRKSLGMPYPQSPRPGLTELSKAGYSWEAEKLRDLEEAFGADAIIGSSPSGNGSKPTTSESALEELLTRAAPGKFLVQASYSIGKRFQQLFPIGDSEPDDAARLDYASLRPDLIEVLPAGSTQFAVASDGSLVVIKAGDTRIQLRVIDIKLSADPSPAYFAEVVLYSIALSAWLVDVGLDNQFIVSRAAAVWPGAHEASELVKYIRSSREAGGAPTEIGLRQAMSKDLEEAPFDVFLYRVRRFFTSDLPNVLAGSWDTLEFHVDNRCSFCEYLGEDRPPSPDEKAAPHPLHCLPLAARIDHVSRVAFVSQGARITLNQNGIHKVDQLKGLDISAPVFDKHQTLRATRTVVAGRAQALADGQVRLPEAESLSASMPFWPDLRLFVSVDFDIGSAITVAFGLSGFWVEPRPYGSPIVEKRHTKAWAPIPKIVLERSIETERKELLAFLEEIHLILSWCQERDTERLTHPSLVGLGGLAQLKYRTRVQVYIWDELQFQHLTRIVGRHLQAILENQDLSHLAWLFPAEELVPNPELVTRKSPISIVKNVVKNLVAAPVPHYYSLFEIARNYHHRDLPEKVAKFSVHPLFSTSLSDQVPSERAHEIWQRVTRPHYQQQIDTFQETVAKRLAALETVSKRIEEDLRPRLTQSAPPIESLAPPDVPRRMSRDGQLLLTFAKLDAAINQLDVQVTRSMPVHERAARFRSARLSRRIEGAERTSVLESLSIRSSSKIFVYELRKDSIDVKLKVGEFNLALSTEALPGFLEKRVGTVVRGSGLEAQATALRMDFTPIEQLMKVTVIALDRSRGLVVLEESRMTTWPNFLQRLEQHGLADFTKDAVLDPTFTDFFSKKLANTLAKIGNPRVASQNQNIGRALGRVQPGQNTTPRRAVHEFLWTPNNLGNFSRQIDFPRTRKVLQSVGLDLNGSQWSAWEDALSSRARLIWGPPGTGKSRTVRAIIAGAIAAARDRGETIRVLLSATTYTAVDNVLVDLAANVHAIAGDTCSVIRVRSSFQEEPADLEPAKDLPLDGSIGSENFQLLRRGLEESHQSVIVAALPQQVYKLLNQIVKDSVGELFDLIVVDEASQMDVGHAILCFASVATGGSIILAGDPLQLPPIHQAEPPTGLEHVVGSIYQNWRTIHQVAELALTVNYRSGEQLVGFSKIAGYPSTLCSYSPNLQLRFTGQLPNVKPEGWPTSIGWHDVFPTILDPKKPAIAIVHTDGKNSQKNQFEAEIVVGLVLLAAGRLSQSLRNERSPSTGELLPESIDSLALEKFFRTGVGVVTPHRAQQALIITKLIDAFQASGDIATAIRDSVDTVERFQGQQRDIVIASYTLGDPDQIALEDEFILALNRFNVVSSRARAKFVALVSRELVNHLASDIEVLKDSRLLKHYAEDFCSESLSVEFEFAEDGVASSVAAQVKWHAEDGQTR